MAGMKYRGYKISSCPGNVQLCKLTFRNMVSDILFVSWMRARNILVPLSDLFLLLWAMSLHRRLLHHNLFGNLLCAFFFLHKSKNTWGECEKTFLQIRWFFFLLKIGYFHHPLLMWYSNMSIKKQGDRKREPASAGMKSNRCRSLLCTNWQSLLMVKGLSGRKKKKTER